MIESSRGGHLDTGEVPGVTERSQVGTSRPALTLAAALLSAFSASLTVGIITLRWSTGVSEFGEAFVEARHYFEWLPPILLVIVVAIFSTVWFVRKLGYARVLLAGALSQAICLAAVGLMPVAFEVGGSSSASSLLLFAAYLANAAKGLCDEAAFLMIASFFSGRDRHAWGRLLACWIAASLVLNLISQNISAMPVVVAIGAVASLSLGACSIGLWNTSLTDAIDPRSARQKVWSFVSPAFIVLLVLSTATWYVGSFDASKFLRFGLGGRHGSGNGLQVEVGGGWDLYRDRLSGRLCQKICERLRSVILWGYLFRDWDCSIGVGQGARSLRPGLVVRVRWECNQPAIDFFMDGRMV